MSLSRRKGKTEENKKYKNNKKIKKPSAEKTADGFLYQENVSCCEPTLRRHAPQSGAAV